MALKFPQVITIFFTQKLYCTLISRNIVQFSRILQVGWKYQICYYKDTKHLYVGENSFCHLYFLVFTKYFLFSRNFENGICFYGKTCVFAHGTEELRFSLANIMNPEMLLSYAEEQNEKKEENSGANKTSRIVDPSISYASVLKNKF